MADINNINIKELKKNKQLINEENDYRDSADNNMDSENVFSQDDYNEFNIHDESTDSYYPEESYVPDGLYEEPSSNEYEDVQKDDYVTKDKIHFETRNNSSIPVDKEKVLADQKKRSLKENLNQNDMDRLKINKIKKPVEVDKANYVCGTCIGVDTVISGNISSNSTIAIDGTVMGSISSKDAVTVLPKGMVYSEIVSEKSIAILGQVSGDIKGRTVEINGRVTGNIQSEKKTLITDKAVIIGDIYADEIEVFGAVKGNIDVRGCVSLRNSAKVKGNIKAKSIVTEPGAMVNGICNQCYAEIDDSIFDVNNSEE